jgi:hypothetical protein
MDFRNRLGLYGAYLCASDRAIGWISTGAALAGLATIPDRPVVGSTRGTYWSAHRWSWVRPSGRRSPPRW